MPEEVHPINPTAIVYLVAVLGTGIVLWLLPRRIPRADRATGGLPPWRLSWIDFGLWLWFMFMAVFGAQTLVFQLVPAWTGWKPHFDSAAPPGAVSALLAGATLQVPMLLVFLGARAWKPNPFRFTLDSVPLSPVMLVQRSIYLFLLLMPLVWVVNFAWALLLGWAESAGLPVNTDPQPIVTIISETQAVLPMIGFIFLAVVIAPLNEELVFRAGVYRFFKDKAPRWAALGASGVLFALLHANLASFAPLLFLGVALALIYEYSGSIRVAVAVHALFNANQLVFIFLHQSGAPIAPAPG